MVERRSALAAVYRPGAIGAPKGRASVTLSERTGRTLVQVSGWPESFAAAGQALAGALGAAVPGDCRTVASAGSLAIFRVAPERLWIAGPDGEPALRALASAPPAGTVVTEIGESRTVVRVAGPGARELLNSEVPVDLDAAAFPPGAFVQSVVHGMPVLVHCVGTDGGDELEVYVGRDYAVSFWEWLTHAALPLGAEVERVK